MVFAAACTGLLLALACWHRLAALAGLTWYLVLLLAPPAVALNYEINVPGVGPVDGAASRFDGLSQFLGIPYAKAPLKDLRWQVPQEHEAWETPRSAKKAGSICLQDGGGSEDCLFLNVYTPTTAWKSQEKLPVMFFIHGGAYQSGAGDDVDGGALAQASNLSAVVVTINYRLNIFGFACSEEIQKRTSDGSCGNFGIQDQRFAMEWVSKHIQSFGGDGSDITIFGESAGGNSVINHLAQPASFHLYKKAIIESGAYDQGAVTFKEASTGYSELLKDTSCRNIACLLALSGKKLVGNGNADGPVVDNVSLSALPTDLISQGKHNKGVPVIVGSNRDEAASSWFSYDLPTTMNEKQFDKHVGPWYGKSKLAKIKELYDKSVYPYPKNLGKYTQWWWTATRLDTDAVPGLGACGARWLAKLLLKGGSSDVHTYLFAHPTQFSVPGIPGTGRGSVIVPHAAELLYVFPFGIGQGDEEQLAAHMSKYWVNFAVTGDPNDAQMPKWPKYALASDMDLRLDIGASGIGGEAHLRKAACDWLELPGQFGQGHDTVSLTAQTIVV